MHGQTFGLNEICWITGFGKTKETDGERQMLDCVCVCVCVCVCDCIHVFLFFLLLFVFFCGIYSQAISFVSSVSSGGICFFCATSSSGLGKSALF